MTSKIKFGTDGWRGIIAEDFTFDNVKLVAQAISDCLGFGSRLQPATKQGTQAKACDYHDVMRVSAKPSRSLAGAIIVGFDRRFLSDRFAQKISRVIAGNGHSTFIMNEAVPTPLVSWTVKNKKAALGLMVTASHNPPDFNGIKIKGPHGQPADPDFTKQVEEAIAHVATVNVSKNGIPAINTAAEYIKDMLKWINTTHVKQLKGKIIADVMHGASAKIAHSIFNKLDLNFRVLREKHDPMFGNTQPEPIEKNLSPLIAAVKEAKGVIGIALDGDGDRVGIVDDTGRYLSPHQVFPLILLHLIEDRKLSGKIVQTVSLGYVSQRIAEHFKLPFEELPVGFKHVSACMLREKVMAGGEESGGYGVNFWLPERDGMLSALLVLEMVAARKKSLSVLVKEMEKRFGESHFTRLDCKLASTPDKVAWVANIKAKIPKEIAGNKVSHVKDLDGLKITFDNGSWLLMRPSGTEPLLRLYAESPKAEITTKIINAASAIVARMGS